MKQIQIKKEFLRSIELLQLKGTFFESFGKNTELNLGKCTMKWWGIMTDFEQY